MNMPGVESTSDARARRHFRRAEENVRSSRVVRSRLMRRALVSFVLVVLSGCGPEAPQIRDLKYSPNAGLVGEQTTISGTIQYTDPDNDISQSVVELYAPNGMLISTTPPTPIQNVGQGPIGSVGFSIERWTPEVEGIHRFNIYIIDLRGAPSNKLQGILRVATP
jgi:hypothetical protein